MTILGIYFIVVVLAWIGTKVDKLAGQVAELRETIRDGQRRDSSR